MHGLEAVHRRLRSARLETIGDEPTYSPWATAEAAQVVSALHRLEAGDARPARHLVGVIERSDGAWVDLVDGLAKQAAQQTADRPDRQIALELLLELIETERLSIPAIRRFLVDGNAVDEVAQDVLVAVATSIGSFQGRSRFVTWLHSLASNQAKLYLRSQSRRPRPADADEYSTSELRDQQSVSLRLSSLVARRESVDDVISVLPEPYRTPVVLRDVDQLPYAEIADRLEIGVNTVRSRIHRGRALLVNTLAQYVDADQEH